MRARVELTLLPPPAAEFDRERAIEWLGDVAPRLLLLLPDGFEHPDPGTRSAFATLACDLGVLVEAAARALGGQSVEVRAERGDEVPRLGDLARIVGAIASGVDAGLQQEGIRVLADALAADADAVLALVRGNQAER